MLQDRKNSRRRLSAFVTFNKRRVISQIKVTQEDDNIIHALCELDSHFDTCVAGPNCIILEYTDQVVNVTSYSDQLDTIKNVPVITAATAIDNENTGTTTILILGQAIYMGDKVKSTLICPNQLCSNGIIVDDVPVHLAPEGRASTHSIICTDDNLSIPMSLKGVISCFPTRTQTPDILLTCKRVVLTDENSWDPHSESFQEQEENHQNRSRWDYQAPPRHICSMEYTTMHDISNVYDVHYVLSAQTTKHHFKTSAEKISKYMEHWSRNGERDT